MAHNIILLLSYPLFIIIKCNSKNRFCSCVRDYCVCVYDIGTVYVCVRIELIMVVLFHVKVGGGVGGS